MSQSSLMTLPSEIRFLIWRPALPEIVELKILGCYETGEAGAVDHSPLPQNPRVPLMLINRKAKEEVSLIPPITLVVRIHDHIHLDEWCQSSTIRDRKLVSRVRVDSQVIRDLAHESLPSREKRANWYISSVLGDELARGYSHVKVLESELGTSRLDGWLDVTFEVGDARKERLMGTAGCHSDKVKTGSKMGMIWARFKRKGGKAGAAGSFAGRRMDEADDGREENCLEWKMTGVRALLTGTRRTVRCCSVTMFRDPTW